MKTRWLLPCLFAGALMAAPTLDRLAADPQLWPAEVAVTSATRGTVIKDGKPAGMMLVGAGSKIAVTGIAADGVTGKLGGTTVKVAVDRTDLLRRNASAAAAPATVETAPAPTPASAAPTMAPTPMQRQLSSKLVRLENGKLASVNTDTALSGVKYYGLYYSASWCGPCRQFTPGFVRTYRELKQKHPEFEVVFVSADRSSGDMANYMKKDAMPWLALKYDLAGNSGLQRYAGPGIPCLVLVDASGKVLADSFRGENYLGPQHVLAETRRILARGN